MTLEQAMEVLISRYNSGVIRSRTNDDEWRLATDTVIVALRGPQPDPDTGLVRCGCGGKAEIRKWEWANDTYIAGCTVCDANVDFPYDIDETDKIISDWNRAMGRRTEK